MNPVTPPRLTPGQRRHIEGSLRQLDAEIEESIQWFGQCSLPGDERKRATSALRSVRTRIRYTAERLGLSLSQVGPDPRRRLAALAGHWWGLALDCRSRALRGYGDVDPEVANDLDPLVDDLAAHLMALGGLLEPPGKG